MKALTDGAHGQQLQPEWFVLPASPPSVTYRQAAWDWSAICTRPRIHHTAWVAPGVVLYGRVIIQARASVWFQSVLRGDHEWIEVGEESNIQDGCILHVDPGAPCRVGRRVIVGHRAIIHGCTIEDDALIGMGAIVLSRCVVGEGALIAAGSVLKESTVVPPRTLWAGCPARQIRQLTQADGERQRSIVEHYVNNAEAHRAFQQQWLHSQRDGVTQVTPWFQE